MATRIMEQTQKAVDLNFNKQIPKTDVCQHCIISSTEVKSIGLILLFGLRRETVAFHLALRTVTSQMTENLHQHTTSSVNGPIPVSEWCLFYIYMCCNQSERKLEVAEGLEFCLQAAVPLPVMPPCLSSISLRLSDVVSVCVFIIHSNINRLIWGSTLRYTVGVFLQLSERAALDPDVFRSLEIIFSSL